MKSESYMLFSTDLLMLIFLLVIFVFSYITRFASDTMPLVYTCNQCTQILLLAKSPNRMPAGIMIVNNIVALTWRKRQ